MAARIMCLIILALEARGLYISISDRRWKIFAYYTQLSNLMTAISALCLLAFGTHSWTILLRYLSSCMLVMTFIVTTCVLIPLGGDPKMLLLSGNGFYHHLVIPVVSVGSYFLLEKHVDSVIAILMPAILTLIYGLIMLYMNSRDLFDGPYPFFRVKNQSSKATVLWMSVLTAVISVISFAVFLLGR